MCIMTGVKIVSTFFLYNKWSLAVSNNNEKIKKSIIFLYNKNFKNKLDDGIVL